MQQPTYTRPVRRGWRAVLLSLGLLALLCLPWLPAGSAPVLAQQQPTVQIDRQIFDTVEDWQQGAASGLLVSNNDGGELRLSLEETQGLFLSEPLSTTFTVNAVGAVWRADIPPRTTLALAVRGRATPPAPAEAFGDAGWGPWFPLVAADARSQADDGAFATADVRAFPADTSHLQLRVVLESEERRASAVLRELSLISLDTTEGPPTSPGLPREPIQAGPDTLTPPPPVVLRQTWSGTRDTRRPNRAAPRGVIVHELDTTEAITDTLALLRATAAYQDGVLGWGDMVYHYVIDRDGTLYAGRYGGPSAQVTRLAAGDTAAHVALIGSLDEAPTQAAQDTLVRLLAWLGEAYDLPPTGEHPVLRGEERALRPTVASHSEVVPAALDPGELLRELLPELRTRADRETIRSRWYFAEGNTVDYTQQLALLNLADVPAEALVTLLPASAEPITRTIEVPAGGRAELLVNDVVTGTTNLPAVVEANRPIVAERILSQDSDLDSVTGIDTLARVWYFAEGSTIAPYQTYLLLFNPQPTTTEATITYMREDGSLAQQQAVLPPRQSLGVAIGEVLPDTGFGIRVVARQPIAVERTMRFGDDNSGLHTTPGITDLARNWFFAEGSTQAPFAMNLLLLNPNAQATLAAVTFMTPDGTSLTRRYALPPTTRLNINVNEVVPELGVAAMVEADRPIAAERALYFTSTLTGAVSPDVDPLTLPERPPVLVGTVSFGAPDAAYNWYFADGTTENSNQFLLLSNPSRGQARVQVEFLLSDGSADTQTVVMPAGSRFTLTVHELYPDEPSIAAIVRSTQPIVAERSIFPRAGTGAGGGTTTLGVPGNE